MAERHPIHFDQPRSVFSTWVGVVLLFVIFGLIAWVLLGGLTHGNTYEEKRAQAREEKLKEARKGWDAALHSYGWIDKAKGTAHVPIDRAMQLTMAELSSQRPRMAGPIATPAPAAAAAPTTSPAPEGQKAVTPAPSPAGSPDMRANPTPKPDSVGGPNSEIQGQPTGAANPPPAAPGTQPGASGTPAAAPPANAEEPRPAAGSQAASPVPTAPGTPLPVAGKTPVPNE